MAWATPVRPSRPRAWLETDEVHSIDTALPGAAPDAAHEEVPAHLVQDVSQILQEHQASQTDLIAQWVAREEARVVEGYRQLEELLQNASSASLPGDSSSSRIETVEEDHPDGLETVVLDCDQTVAASGTEVVFPLRSSLRKHGAKQQNCLEEWSRRHEQLRKEAFLRMQTLLQSRRQPPQGATFNNIPGCYKSSSDDLCDSSSEDHAMKDVGETGGTPDVQQATRQGTAWTPATVDWCRWIFLILDDPEHFIIGKVISAFIILTILVSTTTFILESMPSFQHRPALCEELLLAGQPITKIACEPVPDESFFYLEIVCIAIFTIEYLARLLTCHTEPNFGGSAVGRTLRYARTPLNIIDILAVAPFYLGFLLGNSVSSLRVLRLFRVVRLFKLAKHHGGIRLILEAMANSGFTLAILMFFNVIVGLFFACVIYYMEGQQFSVAEEFTRPTVDAYNNTVPAPHPFGVYVRTDAQGVRQIETPFRSIPICLWWVFTTMTTVGYGDMVPTTPLGKVVGVICFYCGVILLALPIGVLSTNFEQAYAKNNGKDSIQNLVLSLHRRTSTTVQVGQRRSTGWLPQTDAWSVMIFALLSDASSSKGAKAVSWFVTVLILVTTVSMLLESLPAFNSIPAGCKPWPEITYDSCRPRPGIAFEYIEAVCIGFFTVEYVLRILLVHRVSWQEIGLPYKVGPLTKTWKYATQWLNLVDFLAIAPYYVSLSGLYEGSTGALRVLRLVRVFRLLKSPKLRDGVDMVISVVGESLPGILSVFSLTSIVCILFSSCLWIAEGTDYSVTYKPDLYPRGVYVRPQKHGYGQEPTPFTSISHCFWWFFVTATTVGYGDEFPTTTLGRVTAVGTFYAGIVLVAIELTIVGRALKQSLPQWSGQVSSKR